MKARDAEMKLQPCLQALGSWGEVSMEWGVSGPKMDAEMSHVQVYTGVPRCCRRGGWVYLTGRKTSAGDS